MAHPADYNQESNSGCRETSLERRRRRISELNGTNQPTLSRSHRIPIHYDEADLLRRARGDSAEQLEIDIIEQPIPLTEADAFNLMDENLDMYQECVQMALGVHPPSYISDGIYISNFGTARAYLQEEQPSSFPKIKYVLSLIDYDGWDETRDGLEPSCEANFPDSHLMRVNMKDSTRINFLEWFPKICAFIHKAVSLQREPKLGVLVHCRNGISRSVTAVIAYLMWSKHWGLDRAFDHVKSKRKVTMPNREFLYQLYVWDLCNCHIYYETGMAHPTYLEWLQEKQRLPAVSLNPGVEGPEPVTALEGIERPTFDDQEDAWCSGGLGV